MNEPEVSPPVCGRVALHRHELRRGSGRRSWLPIGAICLLAAVWAAIAAVKGMWGPALWPGIAAGCTAAAGLRLVAAGFRRPKTHRFSGPDALNTFGAGRWTEEGSFDGNRGPIRRWLAAGFWGILVLAPWNVLGILHSHRWAWGVLCPLDLLILLTLGTGIYLWMQRRKFGGSRLDFRTFPFFLGEALAFDFSTTRGLGHFRELRFILTCVEEGTPLRVDGGRGGSRRLVSCFQLWSQAITYRDELLEAHMKLPVCFQLPSGELGMDLAVIPVRYWELEVHGRTAGIRFDATFLIPVIAAEHAALSPGRC